MRVVAFTGMPGSGKSVAADAARELGWTVVRMGDCVWDEVTALGWPLTDENVSRVAREMRARHGPEIFAKLTLGKVRHLHPDKLAIDGVRSPEEVSHFQRSLKRDFVLVAILAADAERFRRVASRKREDEALTRAAFEARDARERAFGVQDAIAMADHAIRNEGVEKALRVEVQRVLEGAS